MLAQLDELLLADRVDRWVVVTGGPGMGKSALLAAWLAQREATGAAVPHHFIRRGEYDWDDPAKLVGSLVAQIEARFPDQREPDPDPRMHPAARLAATLARVSRRELAPRGVRLVLLIDGLDEYDPPADAPVGDPLAAFLPHVLPHGVSLLCASRPRHPHLSSLEAREAGLVRIDLDDPRHAADNAATVRTLWEHSAPGLELDARFIDEAVTSASGNVQHAVTLQKHLAGLPAEQRRVEAIPRGLAALLERSWERVANEPISACGLGVLCAAREALTLDELGAVAGWAHNAQRRAFLHGARELLLETRRPNGQVEYRLHHDSIRSHIAGALGAVAVRRYHAALAQRHATWPAPVDATARRYALRHALRHRVGANAWLDAWRLAADMSFLEARCRELGAHQAEIDVAWVAERCRDSGDEILGGRFDDLARAVGRESHWLRAAPEATPALVWNRLKRLGWSDDDLDRQLQMPSEAPSFLRVRHAATRESAGFVRDLVGHAAWVSACAVTFDGRRVVSASGDNTLRVWDLASGHTLTTLQGHAAFVHACAVTPDGNRAASASEDRTLKVWDLTSGHLLATLEGHTARVNGCAVTPDGRCVISASEDRTLKVWDLASGQLLATLKGHASRVNGCAVTPDGRCVISASADRTLKIWELATGRLLSTLEGHEDTVLACAVTPDGRRVVSASADRTLRVWDLASMQTLATIVGHTSLVIACAVTPDGRRVVSASADRTLKVWDLASGQLLATIEGHAARVNACAVTPDGRRVVSGAEDPTLKVWDLATPERRDARVNAVVVDRRRGVSVSADPAPRVRDLAAQRPVTVRDGHVGWVNACAVTPDGRRAISASNDQTLKIWDVASGQALATLNGHSARVLACAVAPGGRVVSASNDQTLKIWDPVARRPLATLEGHVAFVRACAVTPDGRHVISASADHTLKLWDLASGGLLATLEGHTDWVRACAVTPDSRHVISASADQTLKLWDLASGRTVATLKGHASMVLACAVTPDGRCAVSASADHTLKLWDLASGRPLATLEGHGSSVRACAVTPDGRRVVSASDDKTLKLWDLDSGTCLLTHRASAAYTAVTATATTIIAGDVTGAVWFLDWPRPPASQCRVARRTPWQRSPHPTATSPMPALPIRAAPAGLRSTRNVPR